MTGPPGFWMNETSGVLRAAVEAYYSIYLDKPDALSMQHVGALRAYFRQWILHPGWIADDPERLEQLRRDVDRLHNRRSITQWLDDCQELGIDPL